MAKDKIINICIFLVIFLIYINSNKSIIKNSKIHNFKKEPNKIKIVEKKEDIIEKHINNLNLSKKDSIIILKINDNDEKYLNLRKTYYNEIGVVEEGGNNKGKKIKEYLNSVNLSEGYPWCAAFIAWGLIKNDFVNPESAWSPIMTNYNIIYKKGDKDFPTGEGLIFGLYYTHLKRIGHVGFIEDVKYDYVITIEGNTGDDGSRDGDGVYRKRRPKNVIYRISKYDEIYKKIKI